MDTIIKNLFRIFAVSFYPVVLVLLFIFVLNRKEYYNTLKKNIRYILFNTVLISSISIVVIFVFFKYENMIYSYDYAGHWVRALEMRDLFFSNPFEMFPRLYQSMNYSDYSYLPSIVLLPITIINTSYGFFCIGNFVMFILPTVILLEILYYSKFDKHKLLPFVIYIIYYPLYFGLFFGEVDCSGLIFIVYSLIILFFKPADELKTFEIISINLSTFMLLFLRRYYLFYIAAMYILFLVKTLISYHRKKNKKVLLNALLSGIVALIVILTFFMPYTQNVLGNNYSEAYEVYDRNNKISAFLNYFSYISISVILYSLLINLKEKKYNVLYLIVMVISICLLFWRTQAFEYHHYNLITIPILFLFSSGIYSLMQNYKYLGKIIIILLTIQSSNIFLNFTSKDFIIFTSLRKQPEIFWGIDEFKELSSYLSSLTEGEGQTIFMATGSSIFNYDLIQNANLPDISNKPKFEAKTFDIRDGLPKDLEYIRYIIISDPIQYINSDYQHMFDVVTNAILNEPLVSDIYTKINEYTISGIHVMIFEKTGEFTPAVKEYFYNQMINYYPDKTELFSYILDPYN